MKKNFLMMACLCLSLCADAQKTILHNVYFPFDSFEMTSILEEQLDSLYDKAPLGCTINLGIVGQIKNHASKNYSNAISGKRSESVKNYLLKRGLKPQNISIHTVPCGKNRLTMGDDNMKKNIISLYEIEWLKPKAESIILVRPDTNAIPVKKPQKFAIYQHNGNTITGQEGTIITFTDNTFEFSNGDSVKCDIIVIELIECLNIGDAITQGLTTRCGSRMLSTGGMIYLMASCDGKQLAIRKNKTVQIKIPTINKMKGMELFWGTYSAKGPDWKQAGQKDNSDTVPANLPVPVVIYNPENTNTIPNNKYYGEGNVLDAVYMKEAPSDSSRKLDYYAFELGKLGWINCDHFYDVKNKTSITVNVDSTIQPFVRMIFRDISCVMPGDYTSTENVNFENIPEGYNVTLVAYIEKNKKLYLGIKEVSIKSGMKENIEMEPVTQTEFKEQMKTFDVQ